MGYQREAQLASSFLSLDALQKINVVEAPLHDIIYSKASQWGCCSFWGH